MTFQTVILKQWKREGLLQYMCWKDWLAVFKNKCMLILTTPLGHRQDKSRYLFFIDSERMTLWPRALCPFLTSESWPLGGSRFDQSFGGSLRASLTFVLNKRQPRHRGPSQQPAYSQSLGTGKGSFDAISYITAYWASTMKLFLVQSTPFT